jgi:hypothetical protein
MESITLQEAISKMNPGDKFKPVSELYSTMEMSKNKVIVLSDERKGDGERVIGLSLQNLGIKGKIIPSNSVVMDVDTFIKTYETKLSQRQFVTKADLNGQRRRDNDYKPLREAIEYAVKHVFDTGTMHMTKEGYFALLEKIESSYENLKPLNKE